MSKVPFTAPEFKGSAFNCPHCHAYAGQFWSNLWNSNNHAVNGWTMSQCTHCSNVSMWHVGKLIHPDSSTAPLPNADIPSEILEDYDEARTIISRSPRGAAALFRLCIQKLCKHLGESGKNINDDIASLVQKGLSPLIQKSLDAVRVIGNEAVHPGTMDLRDNAGIAVQLANLINITADAMITQPKAIQSLYDQLPESKRNEITRRDRASVTSASAK